VPPADRCVRIAQTWAEVSNLKRTAARQCYGCEQNIGVRKIALFGLDLGGSDRARDRKVPPSGSSNRSKTGGLSGLGAHIHSMLPFNPISPRFDNC